MGYTSENKHENKHEKFRQIRYYLNTRKRLREEKKHNEYDKGWVYEDGLEAVDGLQRLRMGEAECRG